MQKEKNKKKKRSLEERKELNWKIAEIIWYSIGGIILLGGLTFSTLGILIMNMDGNFNNHVLYPLYQSQGEFITWLGFGSSYANLGLMLILIAIIYFAIVFFAFSKRADIKAKRKRQAKKPMKLIKDEETPVVSEVTTKTEEVKS